MKSKNDLYCGAALLAAGIYIGWESSAFPALAGMPYGSGLFPTIAAVGMAACGVLVLFSAILAIRVRGDGAAQAENQDASGRNIFLLSAVIVAVILYAIFFEKLGFHLVSFLTLLGLFLLLKVEKSLSCILATAVTAGVHFIFYSMLHVPLPWGVLEPLAW